MIHNMNRVSLFLLLTFGLLSCSEGEKKPEVEYSNIHDLCKSPDATPEQIQEFLDLNVDLNEKKGEEERTPLYWAAWNNTSPEVIRLLLKAGADVNAKDEYGNTPLHPAAAGSTPEVISVLLKAGADVNAKDDEWGSTPLHNAALQNENPEVMSVLLKAGADVNAKDDEWGNTPLYDAARANENPEVISVLLKAGADVNAKAENGSTALDYARDNDGLKGTEVIKELGEASTRK